MIGCDWDSTGVFAGGSFGSVGGGKLIAPVDGSLRRAGSAFVFVLAFGSGAEFGLTHCGIA